MARPSKYESVIPPNIEKIKKWLSEGVPERDIADNLGIGYTTWRRWKKQCGEFETVVVNTRDAKVEELENTMFQLAQGFSKTVRKGMKVRNPDGSERVEIYEEVVFIPPNFNALRFLLTNWNKEYANDPALLRIRQEEFEHKKKMDELNSW